MIFKKCSQTLFFVLSYSLEQRKMPVTARTLGAVFTICGSDRNKCLVCITHFLRLDSNISTTFPFKKYKKSYKCDPGNLLLYSGMCHCQDSSMTLYNVL